MQMESATLPATLRHDVQNDLPRPLNMNPMDQLRSAALAMPRNDEDRTQWHTKFNESTFVRQFGFDLDLSDSHFTRVWLRKLQPFHMGGLGTAAVVNGAVIAGMIDIGLGIAGTQQFPDRFTGTVDLSIKLMKPTMGPEVVLYAWATEKRTNVVYVAAEVHDATNGRTAMAQGIVAASATIAKVIAKN
jgi:acyl-coenzyme A thioesterase PaaI-like protein